MAVTSKKVTNSTDIFALRNLVNRALSATPRTIFCLTFMEFKDLLPLFDKNIRYRERRRNPRLVSSLPA
jgi:hypothetical protein